MLKPFKTQGWAAADCQEQYRFSCSDQIPSLEKCRELHFLYTSPGGARQSLLQRLFSSKPRMRMPGRAGVSPRSGLWTQGSLCAEHGQNTAHSGDSDNGESWLSAGRLLFPCYPWDLLSCHQESVSPNPLAWNFSPNPLAWNLNCLTKTFLHTLTQPHA